MTGDPHGFFSKDSSVGKAKYIEDNSTHIFDCDGNPISLSDKFGAQGKMVREGQFINKLGP